MTTLLWQQIKGFLILLTFVVVGGAFFVGVVVRPACAGRRSRAATGHAHHLAFAALAYKARHGEFPPLVFTSADGKHRHSWRVLLLEELDHDLFRRYNLEESWDSPHNRQLADKMPQYFRCSSSGREKGDCETSFFAVGSQVDPTRVALIVENDNARVHWMEPKDLSGGLRPPVVSNDLHGPAILRVVDRHELRASSAASVDAIYDAMESDDLIERR